jgi:microcystin-dependent protein
MNEPYVGKIRMMTSPYAPKNWALCDGRLTNISYYETLFNYYETLFNLIGTTYGGDGKPLSDYRTWSHTRASSSTSRCTAHSLPPN